MLERLSAPESRAKIKAVIADKIKNDRGGGDPKNIQFASCGFDKTMAGKTLADVTRERGLPVTFENAAEVAMEIQTKGNCATVYKAISETDIVRIMKSPYTMIASDGAISAPIFTDVPHPRNYGTFARVLGRYVREQKVLTLENAIWKMSGFPAARLGLQDRGQIAVGRKADISVFDDATVIDKADFGNPHQFSVGFRDVLVNGTPVMLDGKMTGDYPGRVLRRQKSTEPLPVR